VPCANTAFDQTGNRMSVRRDVAHSCIDHQTDDASGLQRRQRSPKQPSSHGLVGATTSTSPR
jgi:hypothetical protein